MKKVTNLEFLVKQIADIRNLQKGFKTNFFIDEEKHTLWIKKGVFYWERVGDTLFLIKENNVFYNVFYISTSIDQIKIHINNLSISLAGKIIMLDIIGHKETCEQLSQTLAANGFSVFCRLVRMSKTENPIDSKPSDDIIYATNEDVKNVHSLLKQYFDERTEQIPLLEELQNYAKQKHILLEKLEGKIAGFVIFEITHVSLYLRYWFVNPDFREMGVGSKLLRRYFYEGRGTKREQLWVICSNENAIKRYCHYGYKNENMYDYVITNKSI